MQETVVDIYVRVSTAEQNEHGYSVGEQQERLKAYCSAHGWIINAVRVDGGFSGASLNRPAIQQVITDAQKHEINKVVVYKLDRISRSQKDTLYLIEEVFLKNKVDFVSMTETLDTSTPFGMAMIGILSVFAQLERETIKERLMLGRDARIKSGKFHGNRFNVIGYDYDGENLTQNEFDAAMVRKVFRMYAEGQSQNQIAKYLNDVNWRNHAWSSSKIRKILEQPLYRGRQRWKGEEYIVENCPCIITDEIYEQVQKELSRRSGVYPQTANNQVSLLGGMIWCGCCGRRYHASVCHDVYRYYCYAKSEKKLHVANVVCDNRSWNAKELDNIVLTQIALLHANAGGSAKRYAEGQKKIKEEISALQSRLKALEKQKEKLLDLYIDGNIERDMLLRRTENINREAQKIQESIDKLNAPTEMLTAEDVAAKLDAFIAGDAEAKKIIAHQLIKKITLTHDDVDIIWNFDL